MNMKLGNGSPEKVGMSAQRIQHVASLAEGWVNQGIHPALVVLVARKGVVVLHEAFGRLTPEGDSPPLELDAIFPLTSLSKPVTATAAMILVEEGLLGPNRPVAEYIPEFAGEGKDKVMVHHLLTHTSGLTDADVNAHAEKKKGSVEIPSPDETQHPGLGEHLFLGYDTPLTFPPGTEQRYCTFGFELLGEIVRRVSEKSLDDFARERLFEPLGMKDTIYIVPETASHRVVKRPADGPLAWIDGREFQETPRAAIGAYSTAMDLAAFGQMFLNHGIYGDARILSPVTVAEMTRNQIPGISAQFVDEYFPEAGTGFSWFIRENKKVVAYGETLQSSKTFCHGGAGGIFLWVDPVYEIVGCYFSVDLGPITVAETYRYWCADLFINAVMAAIVDV
ncbi:MAG: beta-lactamase family protein [Chloroflexi bacterium]|nr:beta-lactamase family protein [Chloroflexota bacterium]